MARLGIWSRLLWRAVLKNPTCALGRTIFYVLKFCHAGAVFDAQLASAEEACIQERERRREEAEAHAETRARASQLQVRSSPADSLAGWSFRVLHTPSRRVSEEKNGARLGALDLR